MRKIAYATFTFAALALMGANLISQHQAIVEGALTELKLKQLPGPPGIVGGPAQFKVTKETIAYLQKLQKQGKVIEARPDGSIHIK